MSSVRARYYCPRREGGTALGDTLRIIAGEAQERCGRNFERSWSRSNSEFRCPAARNSRGAFPHRDQLLAIVIEIQSKAGGNLSEAIGNLSKRCASARKNDESGP